MSAQIHVRSSCTLFFGASLIRYIFFVNWLGDDDVVLAVKLVEGSGVLFIDEILFLKLEFELILSVGLHSNKGNTK